MSHRWRGHPMNPIKGQTAETGAGYGTWLVIERISL